mmetsp:Transcript_591/g.1697  ORF Transcript_591/g.1697 Transcript_591/m.1697 type:complete len:517 (-) Transcript_591:164-1714(-)
MESTPPILKLGSIRSSVVGHVVLLPCLWPLSIVLPDGDGEGLQRFLFRSPVPGHVLLRASRLRRLHLVVHDPVQAGRPGAVGFRPPPPRARALGGQSALLLIDLALDRIIEPVLDDQAVLVSGPHLHERLGPLKQGVHALLHAVGDPLGPLPHLDQEREGRRALPLLDALLCSPAPGLLVAQGDRSDTADEVSERRVLHQVLDHLAVGRANEHDAPLRDRPASQGLRLGSNLVDDHDLRHVVLHRLHHDVVLLGWVRDLHPPGISYGRVGDVAVPPDLVRGVHDDDPLVELIRQHAGDLPHHRGLSHPRPPQQEHGARLLRLEQVPDHLHVAGHRPPHPAGEPHDSARPVPNGADAVQGPRDSRPVVPSEGPDLVHRGLQVLRGDGLLAKHLVALHPQEPGARPPAQVHHDLQKVGPLRVRGQGVPQVRRQDLEDRVEVVAHEDRAVLLGNAPLVVVPADGLAPPLRPPPPRRTLAAETGDEARPRGLSPAREVPRGAAYPLHANKALRLHHHDDL